MRILAIGPHPDDIEIGCGGALLQYARAGHEVYLMTLTGGAYGGDAEVRKKEARASADFMGAKDLFVGGFKDTELAADRQLILMIENAVNTVEPDLVFVNYSEDTHQDHRAASSAAVSATRYVKEVLFYEVPSTYNFDPKVFVDIKDVLEDKKELLKKHASQVDRTKIENLTILESAEACAVFRGYQGRVKFAEGFKPLRILREIG